MIKINSFSTLVTALFVGSGVAGGFYAQDAKTRAAEIEKSFAKFAPTVNTRSDEKNFYVESSGLPDHEMMTGITAWQQQVPLPQKYTGANAWQFPLFPVPAKEPMSAKTKLLPGSHRDCGQRSADLQLDQKRWSHGHIPRGRTRQVGRA